eukprot:163339-Pleurochrysis_carterae.AAC.2
MGPRVRLTAPPSPFLVAGQVTLTARSKRLQLAIRRRQPPFALHLSAWLPAQPSLARGWAPHAGRAGFNGAPPSRPQSAVTHALSTRNGLRRRSHASADARMAGRCPLAVSRRCPQGRCGATRARCLPLRRSTVRRSAAR